MAEPSILHGAPATIFKWDEYSNTKLRSCARAGYRGLFATAWGGWSQDIGASPDAATEEAVMDWFVEEVADYEPNNLDARKTTPAVQVY
ncbi:unnamed protein product [Ectocarpus sp. CCAP 1310/34]|nr:unnamed protein product [Ectocarpus sp. CCAP 1310/34]